MLFIRARAKARDADIVIVNHHLFLADVRLKEEGIAEILPTVMSCFLMRRINCRSWRLNILAIHYPALVC